MRRPVARRLDLSTCNVHIACMGAKTITLKTEAYERLRAARRYPTESFSEVVLRATWPEDTITAGRLLALVQSSSPWFSSEELQAVDEAKRDDAAPEDKWDGR